MLCVDANDTALARPIGKDEREKWQRATQSAEQALAGKEASIFARDKELKVATSHVRDKRAIWTTRKLRKLRDIFGQKIQGRGF